MGYDTTYPYVGQGIGIAMTCVFTGLGAWCIARALRVWAIARQGH